MTGCRIQARLMELDPHLVISQQDDRAEDPEDQDDIDEAMDL